MPNWELTNKRIYQLLKHPYQVDKSIVEDMTTAYLEFAEELFRHLNDLKNNKILIRKLNTAYIELATIKAFEESIPTENNTTIKYQQPHYNLQKSSYHNMGLSFSESQPKRNKTIFGKPSYRLG